MQFEMFLSAMDKYCVYEYLPENRLKVIHLEDDMSLILKLSYFFDYAVQMKKKNKNSVLGYLLIQLRCFNIII